MRLSRDDLAEHLAEQQALLEEGLQRFWNGFEPAYKQLAVTVRVLVHDTARSKSLLTHLGVKDRMLWLSAGEISPGEMLPSSHLIHTKLETTDEGLKVWYEPFTQQYCVQVGRLVDFLGWWNGPVVLDSSGTRFTRSQLVLWVANKSGGAHIDEVPPTLRGLDRENSLGWTAGPLDGEHLPLPLSPVPTTVATIATELELALMNNEETLSPALKSP